MGMWMVILITTTTGCRINSVTVSEALYRAQQNHFAERELYSSIYNRPQTGRHLSMNKIGGTKQA